MQVKQACEGIFYSDGPTHKILFCKLFNQNLGEYIYYRPSMCNDIKEAIKEFKLFMPKDTFVNQWNGEGVKSV